jgi:hypothetical protein
MFQFLNGSRKRQALNAFLLCTSILCLPNRDMDSTSGLSRLWLNLRLRKKRKRNFQLCPYVIFLTDETLVVKLFAVFVMCDQSFRRAVLKGATPHQVQFRQLRAASRFPPGSQVHPFELAHVKPPQSHLNGCEPYCRQY